MQKVSIVFLFVSVTLLPKRSHVSPASTRALGLFSLHRRECSWERPDMEHKDVERGEEEKDVKDKRNKRKRKRREEEK